MSLSQRTDQLTERLPHVMERVPEVTEAGTKISRGIHDAVLNSGEAARSTLDVLHGTWLGHPLHPVLTDLAIGAWTMGALFDTAGLISGDRAQQEAGDALAAIGTAAAVPTALAGLADYTTVPKPAAATATWHALLNSANLGLYAWSLRERAKGRRGRGILLSSLAVTLTGVSAWLGGHLVYSQKVGVDHSEHFTGPQDWRAVLNASDLEENRPRRVEVDGKAVLLYRDSAQTYAIGAVCSHAGGPLDEGSIQGCLVECPWHNSVFDLRTGYVRHGPATQPEPCFDTRIQNGQVEIRLRQEA
ncbi:MAG TPA: DUF2231 domain-containing protein [Trueperaceae bacterium]